MFGHFPGYYGDNMMAVEHIVAEITVVILRESTRNIFSPPTKIHLGHKLVDKFEIRQTLPNIVDRCDCIL